LTQSSALAETRVLYELAQGEARNAAALARALDLDAGYLSRILNAFEHHGWIRRTRSNEDARRSVVTLTAAGRKAFAPIDLASHDEVATLLAPLPGDAADALVRDMAQIERLLTPDAPACVTLRPHRAGDIGWVIERHGALYAQEYGWDAGFEALVAQIAGRFLERYDPHRERCWIAERDGVRAGSVLLVRRTRATAQLRLLLVEPAARGSGLGKRLVDECIGFARSVGYRRMMLWTNAGLDAARGIYESRGFRLVAEEPHRSFGHDLVGQTFELGL
jgi:DNA-binding MarR family transcriptional regulator/N-acetylglutamate synthase-like GNAT family acetyltransferase